MKVDVSKPPFSHPSSVATDVAKLELCLACGKFSAVKVFDDAIKLTCRYRVGLEQLGSTHAYILRQGSSFDRN